VSDIDETHARMTDSVGGTIDTHLQQCVQRARAASSYYYATIATSTADASAPGVTTATPATNLIVIL
jgi:hypothetical protein